jgi:hypothetical protein
MIQIKTTLLAASLCATPAFSEPDRARPGREQARAPPAVNAQTEAPRLAGEHKLAMVTLLLLLARERGNGGQLSGPAAR